MILPEYIELYKPYSAKISLDRTVKWLKAKTQAEDGVISEGLAQVFGEIMGGREFSTEKCSCGCSLTNPNTDINHYMLKKVKEIQAGERKAVLDFYQQQEHTRILAHMKRISKTNKEYIKMNRKKHPFFDWDRSWVVRGVRKVLHR